MAHQKFWFGTTTVWFALLLGCSGGDDAAKANAKTPQKAPPPPPQTKIPDPPAGADPFAVKRMNEYTAEKISQGYVPHGAPEAGSLERRGTKTYPAVLNGGDCYTLAAFGGQGVRDLDIFLKAPSGRVIAKDVLRDSRPIVNTCVQESGPYEVRVMMYTGAGPYTYQMYRNPNAAATAVGIAGVDPTVKSRMDQASGKLVARGFRPVANMAGAGVLSRGEKKEFTLRVDEGGSCYAFAGFAGTGMRDLDIFLLGPGGIQLQRDVSRSPIADVNHFIAQPGEYQIRLLAYAGAGPYAYQVYRRQNQGCP